MSNAISKYLHERIPRYTSYPTAPHFSAGVGPLTYRHWLQVLPRSATLSLYLHVPFCETLCWYCGCHTNVSRHRDPVERYVALLRWEIAMVAELVGGRRVSHVHWGGGTPGIVGPDLFRSVMDALRGHFDFVPDAERAVEIDPRRLTPALADAFAETGINRASLGVQTFNPLSQQAIARVQSPEMTRDCVRTLRAAGIRDINLDLLYGLPHETAQSCSAGVETALALEPARFSVFGYAHVPSVMPHQRVIDMASLPDGPERLRQERTIGEACVRAGYTRIGLDHYARPEDSMAVALAEGRLRRNFQGYTTDSADALIGFGASAISRLPDGYAQNTANLRDWSDRIKAGTPATVRGVALSDEDRLRAGIIERLMCDLRADIPAHLAEAGYPADWLDPEIADLQPLADDGLVAIERGVIHVPEASRSLIRKVASIFDIYLDPALGRHAVAV
ncbi:MAG TPA: oxygen-independent coproporphyrinogen III oxidase [Rhodopila sp.]|uniref:oxygen-independent coproporphyrinogen III oxidase n=1 Tax=Rhodopila sp. TaxID=2480087 RepID=UPI002C5163BA|nr:oxygen-independent coproporphyrinogen III oxidase [Rhodopila sp.]HVY17204.1 oxygen-independent coproporphyrinogen III oxidase [Rhodopila sp.]